MYRRSFISGFVGLGLAGGITLGSRFPSLYMDEEIASQAEAVEFNVEEGEIKYPENWEFDIGNESNLSDELVWSNPSNYNGEGDCDDFAVFMLDALRAEDYRAVCVTGLLEVEKEDGLERGRHMWPEARMDGSYYVFDVNYPHQFMERSDIDRELEEFTDDLEDVIDISYRKKWMFDREGRLSLYNPDF